MNDMVMTANKRTIEEYMDGFRKTEHSQILSCLDDDVEWVIPGAFHIHGKDEFAKHIVDDGFVGQPTITVSRMIEADDVVVAEDRCERLKRMVHFWILSSAMYSICGKERSEA